MSSSESEPGPEAGETLLEGYIRWPGYSCTRMAAPASLLLHAQLFITDFNREWLLSADYVEVCKDAKQWTT